jgi:predicted phage tail protein
MIRDFRKGAAKGEIVLEIGDKGGEYEGALFNCTITPKESARFLIHPKLGKIPVAKSKEWLESAVNMVSLDPVRILNAKPAEQVQLFLEALPINVTADKLGFLPLEKVKNLDLDRHALQVIGNEKTGLYGELYEDRKLKNSLAKDKRSTAREMISSLPENPPEGNWSEVYQEKSSELSELRTNAAARATAIRKDASNAEQSQKDLYQSMEQALDKELAEAIEKLKADTEIARRIARDKRDTEVKNILATKDAALQAAKEEYEPKNQALVSEISQAKTMIDQHAKAESTRELIGNLNAEAEKLEAESKSLTDQMRKLESLKAELLSALPIPGLEISDGEIFDNGIPLRVTNTAEKWRVVFEMGKLKRGPLGFMVIDDAEKFDEENRAAMLQAAESSGMQVIMAERTKGPLAISTKVGAA